MRARPTAVSAALTVAALGALLTACGGGDSGLSKSALDEKANAICAAEIQAGEAILMPSDITNVTQAAPYFDKIVPILAAATARLEALKPAADIKPDWDAFMSLRKQLTTLMKTIQHKADTKDVSGLDDLGSEPALGNQMGAAAIKVGATTCERA